MLTRRQLSAGLIGLTVKAERRIEGSFVNEAHTLGHLIRDRAPLPSVKQRKKIPVVIVGGGIAGLSAAWWFNRQRFQDFEVLELEQEPGGNARSGKNEVSEYPWAAHYLPVPNKESTYVRMLMEELGVLKDGHWEERYLCFSPQERLYIHGRWQEGIEPEVAATGKDREQRHRFDDRMAEFRASGQFTVPMDVGARPSELDLLSMHDWMRRNGFDSKYLHWHVDYACRDDYGARSWDTSAWAGIHYFAGREHEDKGPLTWPEGNGWILKQLLKRVGSFVRSGSMVRAIRRDGRSWRVQAGETEYTAQRVIFAAPTFLARYLVENPPEVRIRYSPWVTANLTLEKVPEEVAWDNVIYDSPGLGYVSATHMSLASRQERTVWTYYRALADGPPSDARKLLMEKNWEWWTGAILSDLNRAHPGIHHIVKRIDVMRLGHAMARPTPGAIFCPARLQLAGGKTGILYANSDVSGFSIFEEAQFRGVEAAQRTLVDI